jgi:heme-degrading monooxygenase HmoA
MLYVRLTFVYVLPEHTEYAKKLYHEEIAPVVKIQKGNMGVWLLEPTDGGGEFISLTEWQTKADADAYEAGGTYRELVEKMKTLYRSKPVLKTYNVTEARVAANIL